MAGDFIKEGTTEGLQELLANTFKKQEGLINSYWDNVAESALIGGLLGGTVGAVTNTKTRELYNDMKRNINVALDVVQNGEKYDQTTQMIARTVLQNFQNITKKPAFVAQTQNSAVEIETVQYDEKKFSANARVENGTQNTNLPFETVFETKEAAVVDSMSRASEYMEGSALQAPMMETPDELLAQYDEEMNRKYEDAVQDFPEKTKEAVRQDFDQLSDKEFGEIFGDEIDAIRSKKHKTLEDEVILEKYDELVEKSYVDTVDEAIKGIEDEVKYFTEDGVITNQDIRELAEITYKTLAPATMRNTLIRKKDDFFTPSEKRIIQVTPE